MEKTQFREEKTKTYKKESKSITNSVIVLLVAQGLRCRPSKTAIRHRLIRAPSRIGIWASPENALGKGGVDLLSSRRQRIASGALRFSKPIQKGMTTTEMLLERLENLLKLRTVGRTSCREQN